MTKAHRQKAERQTLPTAPTAGQTMIFMIMALLILAVVVVWIFDVHTVLHLKARTQNAGDAAALAAARWQGITLNLIGDLNIMQALALSVGNADKAKTISDVQAQLCFVGPLVGLLASQQAAKNNRIYSNPDYTAILMEHVAVVPYYSATFPEFFTKEDYIGRLANIATQGVAAGPDNTRYVNPPPIYLPLTFYNAVAGRDWCWFYWNDPTLLQSYTGYQYWPEPQTNTPSLNICNSEVFGLGLRTNSTVLPGGVGAVERMNQIRSERGVSPDTLGTISNEIAGITNTWYRYDEDVWTATWSALAPDNNFPILPLQVKPEYDYAGADAVIRVETQPDPRMPGAFTGIKPFLIRSSPSAARLAQSNAAAGAVTWTAAAKPFGYLTADGSRVRPNTYELVLPAFHNVRLIPVDAASGSNIGAYDLDWYRHNRDHMPIYWENGQAGLEADCWYCQQLQTWEDQAFRQQGIDWLSDTNHVCDQFVSGGGPGGGTRRGH